jgi:hypothetical protein
MLRRCKVYQDGPLNAKIPSLGHPGNWGTPKVPQELWALAQGVLTAKIINPYWAY